MKGNGIFCKACFKKVHSVSIEYFSQLALKIQAALILFHFLCGYVGSKHTEGRYDKKIASLADEMLEFIEERKEFWRFHSDI